MGVRKKREFLPLRIDKLASHYSELLKQAVIYC